MLLKKKELLTKEITLDGEVYVVSAMTVHKRTVFESAIVEHGQSYMRELLLLYCVTVKATGLTLFSPLEFINDVRGTGEAAEKQALALVLDQIAEYPNEQLQPLVTACMEVNGLLGNDSPQS